MKKLNDQWPLLIVWGLALSFCSCEKPGSAGPQGDSNSVSAVDYTIVSNAMNATADDAALAADEINGIAGPATQLTGVCGARTVDTANGQAVTITYDSTTFCEGVIRSGTVAIAPASGNAGWATKNSMITITVYNLGIIDPITNERFTLNGSFTISNESGGLLADLSSSQGPIIRRHQSLSTIQVTLNSTTTNWSFDRTRSWTNLIINSTTVMNVKQYTEAATGVECSGTNRYAQAFTSNIDTVIQADTYQCTGVNAPLMEPYAGVVSHIVNGYAATIAYGTNVAGTYTGTNQTCPTSSQNYGYHITYIDPQSNDIGFLFWPYYQ